MTYQAPTRCKLIHAFVDNVEQVMEMLKSACNGSLNHRAWRKLEVDPKTAAACRWIAPMIKSVSGLDSGQLDWPVRLDASQIAYFAECFADQEMGKIRRGIQ